MRSMLQAVTKSCCSAKFPQLALTSADRPLIPRQPNQPRTPSRSTTMEQSISSTVRPPFAAIQTLVADLPEECIPRFPATHAGRLVFVGDVHGQLTSLHALLAKIGFDARAGDHLVLAGDLTNKGPDSAGVVQLAMDVGAHAVRGNHDDKMLRTREALRHEEAQLAAHDAGGAQQAAVSEKEAAARAVAASFSEAQVRWLAALPVMLRVPGGFPGARTPPWNARELVVVHAGLTPGVALAQQDPTAAMKMRGLVAVGDGGVDEHVVAAALDTWNRNVAYRRQGGPVTLARIEEWRARRGDTVEEKMGRLSVQEGSGDMEEEGDLIGLGLVRNPRTGGREVLIPIESRVAKAWSKLWNRLQNSIVEESARTVVIYGHDAKAGLQANLDVGLGRERSELSDAEEEVFGSSTKSEGAPKEGTEKKGKKKKKGAKCDQKRGIRYAFGLDSGCVYGKQLSALIIEAGEEDIVHRIEQVECVAAVKTEDAKEKDDSRKDEL